MTKPNLQFIKQLHGFSRALFSTWLYHRRFNILFDAGEGVATGLQNRVFGIRRVFLSHAHADHIAGLVNLINIRNLGAGDQNAPLEIYYPKNSRLLDYMIEYLTKTQKDLSFELYWIPIDETFEMPLSDQKGRYFIKAFKTEHTPRQLSLGYNILEIRRKLKPEFENATQQEINAAVWAHGKDYVAEDFEQTVFSFAGDSRPVNPKLVKETLCLCHEATYLDPEDDERGFKQHSYLEEVLQTARDAKVANLLLIHVSLRYKLQDYACAVADLRLKTDLKSDVYILYGSKFYMLTEDGKLQRC